MVLRKKACTFGVYSRLYGNNCLILIKRGVAVFREFDLKGGSGKLVKTLLFVILSVGWNPVNATPNWYFGAVSRVALIGGDNFIVTFKSEGLADCLHRYAYFTAGNLTKGFVDYATRQLLFTADL